MMVTALAPLLLAGCEAMGGLWSGMRGSGPGTPTPAADGPPADEGRICQLAQQSVREALGVKSLRGESCSASKTGPGRWEARVAFTSGTERQTYRVELRPHRDRRQGWAVVDMAPTVTTG